MGKDKKDKVIMRHIMEVRFAKRVFSFMDYRGELIDFLANRLSGENIRFAENGTRADIAIRDLSKIFFVSYENFGLQIDGAESFKDFSDFSTKLIEILGLFDKYKPDSVARVGTRSSILFHPKECNFETVKEKYKDIIFANYKDMEVKTNTRVIDLGCAFDLKRNDDDVHISMGPVRKDEAVRKYFKNSDHYDKFTRDGIFFDIDFSKNFSNEPFSIVKVAKEVKCNIDNVEEIFNGFLTYLNIKENGK